MPQFLHHYPLVAKSDKAALLGILGEQLAESYLTHRHYRVIERNWRGVHGEIDLVVTAPDGELVIVEVKARSSGRFGDAIEAIDAEKMRRLHLLARQWCIEHAIRMEYRIDVITLDDFSLLKISHRVGLKS